MAESELRKLVDALHEEHGIGGSSIDCFQCVVRALNQYEKDYVDKIKDKQDGK